MGELGFGEREPPLAVSSPLSSCHASALPSSPPAPVQPPPPPPLLLLLLPPLLSPTERGGGDSGSHPQRAGGWGGFGEHPWPRGLCAVPPPPGWEERRGKGGDAVKVGGCWHKVGSHSSGCPHPTQPGVGRGGHKDTKVLGAGMGTGCGGSVLAVGCRKSAVGCRQCAMGCEHTVGCRKCTMGCRKCALGCRQEVPPFATGAGCPLQLATGAGHPPAVHAQGATHPWGKN